MKLSTVFIATGMNNGAKIIPMIILMMDILLHYSKKNYYLHPEYQRAGGDWLNWQVPGTEYHIPIFQSGFGDGTYPVYWGIDEGGEICQLVIQFIDIELAYGNDEEN